MKIAKKSLALAIGAILAPVIGSASSHREAPMIAGTPQVDGTDFYMFRSYESGRSGYVTFLANYIPVQDPDGGPNFYNLSTTAAYRINIDTTGNANSDISFQFQFKNVVKNLAVPVGGKNVPVPLTNIGPIDAAGKALNVSQTYTLTLLKGGTQSPVENAATGETTFSKPADNVGMKSIADYAGYAKHFMYDINIPGCSVPGKVFVGQRKEGFVVNLAGIFDLVNLNPAGARDAKPNSLRNKNVTTLALELPISCVTRSGQPVIGGYTTSYTAAPGGSWTQVSRVGMPLVNEAVIGLPDKDKFNGSSPKDDAQFLTYVTNPSLPTLLNVLFGSAALVPESPRNDLVAIFLTGVKGINQPPNSSPSEMLRLNTSTPVTAPASQNDLGVLGKDMAGFPNGRRPYDDVTDITLRAAEGALCGVAGTCGKQTADPNHGTPYTDGARAAGPDASHVHVTGQIAAGDTYLDAFPYLETPIPGSAPMPNN